jgi:hypothetical protein
MGSVKLAPWHHSLSIYDRSRPGVRSSPAT